MIKANPGEPTMTREKRLEWLLCYLLVRQRDYSVRYTVDVLDADFVSRYVDATNAPFVLTTIGANRCVMLGRDLAELHQQSLFNRHRTGISGMPWGFPKWVYSYGITEGGMDKAAIIEADKEPAHE